VLDADSWIEPSVERCAPLGIAALQEQLTTDGELVTRWPVAPLESTPTDCHRVGEHYWISQLGVGAIRFDATRAHLAAFPALDGDADWFHEVITRSWLPAIYPFWGRQVIHASAVALAATGETVAFTGPTQAGKSTTAYAIAQRRRWRLVSDDTLAFSPCRDAGGIRLHPLTNHSRLRPASADHFGKHGVVAEPVVWPSQRLKLSAIYLLEGDDRFGEVPRFTRMPVSESLPVLLEQAYALSLEIQHYNRQMMKDYADLAAAVPVFRLQYRRSFALADALFNALEHHICEECGLVATPSAGRSGST